MGTTETTPEVAQATTDLRAALAALKKAVKEAAAADGNVANARILPTAVLQEILALVADAEELFTPYETALTPVERRRLNSMREKRFGFLMNMYGITQLNPSLMPSYMTAAGYAADVEDYEHKRALYQALQEFTALVYNSMLTSSNVAYTAAVGYYNFIKEAARQHVPGADAIYNQMKHFFAVSRHNVEDDQPTEAQLLRNVRALTHGTKEGVVVVKNEMPTTTKGELKVVDKVHSDREFEADETVSEKIV